MKSYRCHTNIVYERGDIMSSVISVRINEKESEILNQAAAIYGCAVSSLLKRLALEKLEDEYAQKLKDNGVTFHEVDAEAFNKAVAPVYEKFPKWTPGIYDKIMENLTQIREDIKNGK